MGVSKVTDTRAADLRSGLMFVFLAALCYSAIHVGFRLLASDVLGEDDVIDNILVQDLRVAYDAFPRQPPLYDWVLWCVQRVTGPGILGFQLIKYTALIATACFLYLTSMRVLKNRLFAILSVESLALIYQISWRYHEGFTHEVGAMVAVMATAWLLLRVIDYGRVVDFVVLGVGVGLGLLTEPAFGVFFVALLVAAFLQRAIRTRLFRAPLVVSVVIALAIVAPYIGWVLSEPHRIAALTRPSRDFWGDAFSGFLDALRGPVAYLSPLLFIIPIVFPKSIGIAWSDLTRRPNRGDEPDLAQLFLHAALVALALSVVGALCFAIMGLAVHVLMPLYVTSVVWLFSVAMRAAGDSVRTRWFARVALIIACIALVARLLNMFVLDPVCNKCRWGIPYGALAAHMRERGFPGGTIVSIDHELAGNLRPYFPSSKIVSRAYPKFEPRGAKLYSGRIAFVWGTHLSDRAAKRRMKKFLPEGVSIKDAELVIVPWHHLYKPDGYRVSKWKLLIVDKGGG